MALYSVGSDRAGGAGVPERARRSRQVQIRAAHDLQTPHRNAGAALMSGVALLVDTVTVEFGSFRAIDMLSLAIDFGEVRAVIGPNGAGKTTLLDVISGITRPQQGRVIFDETTDITRASEAAIARAGVRRKFQKPSIFEGLNVHQHIAIGAQGGLRRSLSRDALSKRVDEVLKAVGLADLAQ